MFAVYIYFTGPRYTWSGKPAKDELIGTLQARWLWLARVRAQTALVYLNAGRSVIDIHRDGEWLERWREPTPITMSSELDHGIISGDRK